MTKTLNATAVIRLTDTSKEFLRKMQLHHPIPEDAKYIAFLEDGDACFLDEDPALSGRYRPPFFMMLSYYENIPIEFED